MEGNLFVHRPKFAMVIAIMIVVLGFIAIRSMPIEQYPDITPPMVEVTATYQGADAITVEQSVATPIEESINGVQGMIYMESTNSGNGMMNLQVSFAVGTNPDMNTIFTQNRVASATPQLPSSVITQGVTTQKTMSNAIMVLSLVSDGKYDADFLTNYSIINIKDAISRIDGVGSVSVMGAGEYAMRIWLHPDKMSYYGLGASEVMEAVRQQSQLLPGGTFGAAPIINPTPFTYSVLMGRNYNSPTDFENVILRADSDGATVLLKDVASVALGSQTYNVNATYQGHPCAIIMINQAPGSNAVEVGDQVQALMNKISTAFPEGMRYETIVNLNKTIISGISDIITTLIIALILVVLVVFLFLQEWRAMIIPLVAIPVSLIGAFMLFPLFGFSINVFSLLGLVLAIGLVVDDAIVVTEAVQVNIEKGQDSKTATINAMKQVSAPIVAMTSVLIAVFLPVALMPGAAGMLYKQFAVTLALTVCISGINSLSLSPALCSLLLRPRTERRTTGFFGGFNRLFARGIEGYVSRTSTMVRHAGRSLVFIVICVVVTLLLFKRTPTGFLPDEDQGYIIANIELPNAASLARTEEVMAQVRELVEHDPNVEATTSAAGFSILGNTEAPNTGVMFIKLKPFKERKMSAAEISNDLNGMLYEAINGGEVFTFGPPSIPGLGPSSGFTIMIQDKGGNTPQYLADYTRRFVEAAEKRPEVASVNTMFAADVPQKMIVVDNLQALGAGVALDELHAQISAYLGGAYINNFNKFGRSYQTYIQAEDSYRASGKDIALFHVTNGQGVSVPISSLITIRDTIGPSYTNRFNLYRSAAVSGLPSPKYSTSQCMTALEEVAAEVLPADMGYAWANMSYQENQKSGASAIFVYAIIFVFLILAALYESWSLPMSIILGIPFAVLGAMMFIFLGHFVETKYINDIFVQISLIMLVGLAAKNAILIVAYAKEQFDQGLSLADAAIAGARLRIRPVLMTAIAFLMGVVPLILATGSNSVARNVMGVALFGGMLLATFIGIFVYPALFVIIGKLARYETKRALNGGVAGKVGAVVLCALFMGSCAVGPKFRPPQVQMPESYIGEHGDTTREVHWWSTFGDTTLLRLIDRAIAHNHTLAMSVSAIEQARLSLGEARTAYYPSLDYTITGHYGKETYIGIRSDKAEQTYSLKGAISWELGLFGLVRRQVEAAKNDLYATEMASRGVLLSLTSEVASAYFSYLGYRYAEEASDRIYMLQKQVYELQKQSVAAGYASELVLNQNIISLRRAETSLSQARQARINATYALSVLLGENPSREIVGDRTFDNVRLPAPLGAGVPADLLNRRPDIVEAYYKCVSANAMIGAAQAARLPSIALTGSGGVLNSDIKELFSSGSWLWMGAGSITGPIFNFGKYRRQVKVAREKSHEATLNYQQTVIEALQDVESSLLDVSESHRRTDALRNLKDAADKAYALSVQQYNYGQINSFDRMAAQTTLLNAEINYAQSVSSLLSAYTALYKSLGGSF